MVYCAATGSQYQVYMKLCLSKGLSTGANLAKPTTTQRALDRVYWEIRWMDLMDSPAAFPCRTILLL